MNITVIGRKCTPRESFKERTEKKLAKLDKFYTAGYPEEAGWLESLMSMESKGNYLDEQLQATLGEYYKPFTFVKNIHRQNAIQARLPIVMNVR